MTDQEWDVVFEQMKPLLKQGLDAVMAGSPVVSASIGVMQGPDGQPHMMKMFIAVDSAGIVLQGTADGFGAMIREGVERMQKIAAEPRVLSPYGKN